MQVGRSRKFLTIALVASSPLLIGATTLHADFDARLLAAQNAERSDVGVQPLVWNDQLAADAKKWADELAATGKFEHSPDEPGQPVEGENLWAGTPHAFSPEAMVGLWAAEKKDYRPGVFPANSRSGDVENVGHYTQMIWRDTHEVGCATATGRREQFLVCRYSQAGNIYGERPA
ncbi:MAG: CAP domain-containing protein [Sphingomicrobium sp.]